MRLALITEEEVDLLLDKADLAGIVIRPDNNPIQISSPIFVQIKPIF